MHWYEIVLTVVGAGGLLVLAVWALLELTGCFDVEEPCDCKICVRDRAACEDRNPFDVDEFDPIQPTFYNQTT